ncbi:hypothetical protein GCM10028818_50010 [Spirosoma horti]
MDVPKASAQDYAIKLTKGALGAIPFAGGLLGELLEMVIVPKQQKKLEEWFEYVENTLTEITEKGQLTKEDIFNDDEFISVFQKSSRIYVNNVEAHKRSILQSYLKAAITKPLPLDKKLIYLDIIDKLTEHQILILKDIYDNEKSENYLFKIALEKQLVDKFAEGNKNYLNLLIKGLKDFHLIGYGSANVVIDGVNQWHMVTSEIAKEYIDYLTAE